MHRMPILCLALCAALLVGADVVNTRPYVIGTFADKAIRESSGIVASRQHDGVFWTHNDSGNAPILFAVRRDGSLINAFAVNTVAIDWEDIAVDDEGHLYLADTGNNLNLRKSVGVIRIDEPDPFAAPDAKSPLVPSARWTLTFAGDDRMDCESLFIWQGSGYVIRKSNDVKPTTLWRFDLAAREPQVLARVATIPVDAIITAADLSPDGDALALMSVDGPILFTGLAGDLSRIETRAPAALRIERRTNEAICFARNGLLGTSEGRDVYFFPFAALEESSSTRPSRSSGSQTP